AKIFQRRRFAIDENVIDDLVGSEINGAQFLRDMRPITPLSDMHIGCQACDQNIGLTLSIKQMTQMTRMHNVENAMTHDNFFLARHIADHAGDFVRSLDLVSETSAK